MHCPIFEANNKCLDGEKRGDEGFKRLKYKIKALYIKTVYFCQYTIINNYPI